MPRNGCSGSSAICSTSFACARAARWRSHFAPRISPRSCARSSASSSSSNPERRIELEVSGDATGEWDPDRIAQVCSNLLSNAIQHGDAQQPVRIRIESEGDDAIVTVENGGPPIPDELRPYLFDPFRRGQPAGDGSKTGLGLGLFIVRQVALAHGGDVSVRSDTNRTVFTVRLPRDRA